jgi:FXSXX-COOH protein
VDALSAPSESGGPRFAPLPDVTGLSFAAMRARRDTALARSLKQVIASLDDPNGVISAFQSFASDT